MSKNDDDSGLVGYLRHPWTAVTAGFGLLGQSLGVVDPLALLDAGMAFVIGSVDLWYPLLSVLRRLGGVVEFIPTALAENLFVVGALVYAAYLVVTIADSWTDYIKQRFNRKNS